ncbi:MAG: hypothetical protein E7Z64_03405 [Thermoplasmata archaeon]|nr:hypothetical protein [Thermoplasmata archaeon]
MNGNTREMSDEEQRVRYNIKDSIFVSFFKKPENVLELYRETHPEDTTVSLEDIKLNSLENVIVTGPVNDLGFIVKDKLLCLIEAQSYYLPSVLLRSFVYMLRTLERFLREKGIDINYAKESEVPEWVVYVIFTKGSRYSNRNEVLVFEDIGKNFFDLSVGKALEMKDGGIIHQYLEVCDTIDNVISRHGHGKDAIEKVFDSCCGRDGAIFDFICRRRLEIMGLYEEMFDREEVARIRLKHQVQEAVQEAVKEATEKATREATEKATQEANEKAAREAHESRCIIARQLISDGYYSPEEISKIVGLPLEEVESFASETDSVS